MPQQAVGEFMQQCAGAAVSFCRDRYGVELDYSEESIAQVEKVLGKMEREIPKGFLAKLFGRSPKPEAMSRLCLMFGGYFGEVVRRHLGGEWKEETEPQPMIALDLRDAKLYPQNKVWKRLMQGPGDNVASYYDVARKLATDPTFLRETK